LIATHENSPFRREAHASKLNSVVSTKP
jgi:hypothetical protein